MTSTQKLSPRDLGVSSPVSIDSLPWAVVDLGYGRTEFKTLRINLRENSVTTIIRWEAGIQVPKHRHFGPVHAYTFSGKWHYKEYDWFATAGTYLVETPETEHSLVVDEDVEAMFTMYGGMVDLGPDNELLGYQDAQTALDYYQGCLSQDGLELPEGIVQA
jgi:2,4'-dihydroxyacetophenone dioxygenase